MNGTTEWILYTLNRSNGTLDTVALRCWPTCSARAAPSLGLPASDPVATGSSTVTAGSNTISNTPGGVSTSNLTVADTSAFKEIPGRIYITIPSPGPAAATSEGSLVPLAGIPLLGLRVGAVHWRSRRRRA